MAVLNFASFKNPGGRYIEGSMAQEEALCSQLFLYNCLRQFKGGYYNDNCKRTNNALYYNRAIYLPDIYFFDNKELDFRPCDVITCAAPNRTAVVVNWARVTEEENLKALQSRIHFVLFIAADQKVEKLILGAFGCGVFGQDAAIVAKIFKDYLDSEFKGVFKEIIYAIPDDRNLIPFLKTCNISSIDF